jgi:hypothetical protein
MRHTIQEVALDNRTRNNNSLFISVAAIAAVIIITPRRLSWSAAPNV